MLKPSEQEEVISQADDKLKSIPNYTKEEIQELLEPALGKLVCCIHKAEF